MCECVLHASVFPKELTSTAAAVSPYKDACSWKKGWECVRGGQEEWTRGNIDGGQVGTRADYIDTHSFPR